MLRYYIRYDIYLKRRMTLDLLHHLRCILISISIPLNFHRVRTKEFHVSHSPIVTSITRATNEQTFYILIRRLRMHMGEETRPLIRAYVMFEYADFSNISHRVPVIDFYSRERSTRGEPKRRSLI